MTIADNEKLECLSDVIRASWMPRPRGGRPINIATISKWASQGVRGVFLEVVHVGATVCTSREAVSRFFAAVADAKQKARAARRATPNTARDSRRSAATKKPTTTRRKAAV